MLRDAAEVRDNAGAAVEMYHRTASDVLVLDVMLPDRDGLGVLRQVRTRRCCSPRRWIRWRIDLSA
jgi:two-component system response regulator TrcR